MTAPVWYQTSDGLGAVVNLAAMAGFRWTCPADQRFMPRRADGEQVCFLEANLPAPDRYGKGTAILFAGSYTEVRAELDRVYGLLGITS